MHADRLTLELLDAGFAPVASDDVVEVVKVHKGTEWWSH
jgi:hypothetical protein